MHNMAIIQARMGSSRLPGKVLKDISGKPMLLRVLERVSLASRLNGILVATTLDPSDDPIADLCREKGYRCFRGSQFNVLDRFYQAALQEQVGTIVRITADCPLSDPYLLDHMLGIFEDSELDFLSNRLPPPFQRSFPIGLDIEICTFVALERAWREVEQPYQREHVMPYIYEDVILNKVNPNYSIGTSSHGFKVCILDHVPDLGHLRWTVDTPQDLESISLVYELLGEETEFTWKDILELFNKNPELLQVNDSVQAKNFYDHDQRSKED